MTSPRELLAKVPLFRGLDDEDVDEIAASMSVRTFDDGDHVFHIGEPGRSLFIVAEGSVLVHHPDRESHFELAEFGPGEFFGEMALLNSSPRSASARAVGPVRTLVLDKVDFRRILTDKPEVALQILEAMSVRVRTADDLIQGLTNHTVRDPLTGLLNRRAFHERLDEEIARTRRYGQSFSLIIIDLDDLDDINDALGRETGDAILAWVGRVLTEHTRAADVPFRLEDDSFAILCPSTPTEYVRTVAKRLSTLIGEAKPPVRGAVVLTVTTGTATCPADGHEALGLYHTAQRAMQISRA